MPRTSSLKKLAKMSLAEINFRVTKKLSSVVEKRHYYQELEKIYRDDFDFFSGDFAYLSKYYKDGKVEKLFASPDFKRSVSEDLSNERKELFIRECPEEYASSIERADKFVKRKFSCLGVKFQLPEPIPWQSDPLSLKAYMNGFYRDIDIFGKKDDVDVKHVWEVNRLQFLVEIAKAYYLSGNSKYKVKLEEFIKDWYKENCYKTGINWTSALEVGVRVVSLVWILNFYMASEAQDSEVVQVVLKMIYLHGLYLEQNLSFYSSPYNHLIGEATGLFIVGYLFPSFKSAKRWERKGWKILEAEIAKQFHRDGISVEQASFYHHFTLGFFTQAIALRKLNGDLVSENMMRQIEKAFEFGMFVSKPDGTLPFLGDIDDGRSICFSDPTNWDFRSFQAVGAAWFNRSDMKFIAKKYHEDAFWILPDQDAKTFENLEAHEPRQTCINLPESGYYIFRNGYQAESHYSHMDCGPIAHGIFQSDIPSAAHGHADLLAIEIAAYGESFLIDPGFSNYRGEFDWHTYFRSTAAHNTIEIDRQPQAKHGGILEWSCGPRFKVLQTYNSPSVYGVCAEHYGYHRLAGRPKHRRYFLFIDGMFWVTFDEITTKKDQPRKYETKSHFHLKDDIAVNIDNKNFSANCYGNRSELLIKLLPSVNGQFDLKMEKGGEAPNQGWISPTYLARTPAPLVVASAKSYLPFELLTLYVPNKYYTTDKMSLQSENSKILLGNSMHEYEIFFKENKLSRLNVKDYEIRAKLIVHRVRPSECILAVDLCSVFKGDMTLATNQYIFELIEGR